MNKSILNGPAHLHCTISELPVKKTTIRPFAVNAVIYKIQTLILSFYSIYSTMSTVLNL